MKPIIRAATFLFAILRSAAAHAATVRTVALSGQQAPGTLDGVKYTGFHNCIGRWRALAQTRGWPHPSTTLGEC